MNPFFSIITPIYNCEKYVKKCIESVLNQTYDSWELILVDDGSTDSSGVICDSFCGDSRIKVIHQDNQGALKSRLNGISVAKGIYGMGLDADDYLDKKCLETVKKAIDLSHSDLIWFNWRMIIGNQTVWHRCSLPPNQECTQRELLQEVIDKTNHSLCNKVIKIEKMKQASFGGFNEKLIINEDYVHIISILRNINTGYVIDEFLYNYRIYGESNSHTYTVKHIFDTNIATEYVIRELSAANLLDADLTDKINVAYLRTISFRILWLFADGKISSEDCRKIHDSKIYVNAGCVEKIKYLNLDIWVILKLFRFRMYITLKFLSKCISILKAVLNKIREIRKL